MIRFVIVKSAILNTLLYTDVHDRNINFKTMLLLLHHLVAIISIIITGKKEMSDILSVTIEFKKNWFKIHRKVSQKFKRITN